MLEPDQARASCDAAASTLASGSATSAPSPRAATGLSCSAIARSSVENSSDTPCIAAKGEPGSELQPGNRNPGRSQPRPRPPLEPQHLSSRAAEVKPRRRPVVAHSTVEQGDDVCE